MAGASWERHALEAQAKAAQSGVFDQLVEAYHLAQDQWEAVKQVYMLGWREGFIAGQEHRPGALHRWLDRLGIR